MQLYILSFIFIFLLPFNLYAKEYVHLSVKDGLQSDYITSLYRGDEGCMWIGTTEGVARFDGVNIKKFHLLDGERKPSYGQVSQIKEDVKYGAILVLDKNLYKYNRASDDFDYVMQTDHILHSCLRAKGYYFGGSDLGLVVRNEKSGVETTFLKHEKIVNIIDVDDDIYILTPDNLYILYISDTPNGQAFEFNVLQRADGSVFSAMVSENGLLYVGTKLNGLFSFDTRTKNIEKINELGIKMIRALHINGGMLYVNRENSGAIQYDIRNRCIISYIGQNERHTVASIPIQSIFADSQGLLWVGSFSSGLYLEQTKNSAITILPQTEAISVRSFRRLSNNRFIIGSRDGLYLYNNGITKRFNKEDYGLMQSNIILSIAPYKKDTYIICTFNGGAFLLNEVNQRIMPLDMGQKLNDELKNKSVYGVEMVGDDIYFFTLQGLVKCSSNGDIERWGDIRSVMPSSLIFSHCYDKVRNVFWLGTKKGLTRFDIDSQQVEEVVLTSEHNNAPVANNFRTNTITINSDNNILFDKDNIELMSYNPETTQIKRIDFAPKNTGHISGIIQDSLSNNLWIATTSDIYSFNEESNHSIAIMSSQELPSTNICPNSLFRATDGRIYAGAELGLYAFQITPDKIDGQMKDINISNLFINGEDKLSDCRYVDKNGHADYKIKINRNDILEVDVAQFNFSKTNQYSYSFKIDDKEWHYPESNSYKISEPLTLGKHKLYVMVAQSDDIVWSDPVYVGAICVVPTTASILSSVIAIMLIIASIYFGAIMITKKRSAEIGTTTKRNITSPVVTDERSLEVIKLIKEALATHRGYRNTTYRIKDLANETELTTTEISQVLNSCLNVNFTDFINDYRVEEIKEILLKSEVDQYNLHILAEQCGFNSKASFYRVFKIKTGVTPLQYRKQFTPPSC